MLLNDCFHEKQDHKEILETIYVKYKKAYVQSFPLVKLSRQKNKNIKWLTPGIVKKYK